MQIHELPRNILLEIFGYLPEFVLYQLLKSKNCAKQAYTVYYKHVFLSNDQSYTSLETLVPRYLNSHNAKDMETTFKEYLKADPYNFSANPSFHSSRRLVYFWQNTPLFVPHTLACIDIEDLVALEHLQPGLVSKFKHVICLDQKFSNLSTSRDAQVVKDILLRDFSVYVTGDDFPVPDRVVALSLTNEPPKAMPSVKKLELKGLSFTNDILKKVPNVQEICGCLDPAINLSNTGLRFTRVTLLNCQPIDLSEFHSLKDITLELNAEHMVGFTSSCSHKLPAMINRLFLKGVSESSHLKLESARSLKTLKIEHTGDSNLGNLQLPYGLVEFEAIGTGEGPCMSLSLPETIERITINGFGDTSFTSLPVSLCYLNLGRCKVRKIDGIVRLSNLVTLKLDNEHLPHLEFPPNITELDLLDYHQVSTIAALPGLKYLKHSFAKQQSVATSVVCCPSLTHLTLVKANVSDLVGCEKLVSLEMNDCKCPEAKSRWRLDHLEALTLRFVKQSVVLPSLPSLRYLALQNTTLSRRLDCPQNLKFVSLSACDGSPQFIRPNESLEVLSFNDVTHKLNIFGMPGRILSHLFVTNCITEYFAADFTSTSLEEFVVTGCEMDPHDFIPTVKFPSKLAHLTILNNGWTEDSSYFDNPWKWVDVSRCDRLCSFEDVSCLDRYDRRNFVKWKAQVDQLKNIPFF